MEEARMKKIQKWELLVKERLDSGLSVSKFCEVKGYTENMYYHWVNQIHKADPSFNTRGSAALSPTGSFFEIGISKQRKETKTEKQSEPGTESVDTPVAFIEAGDVRISLLSNAAAPFMRQLLEAVRHA